MNISEKEKVKRVEVLAGLEKKIIRRLQAGKTEQALEELRDIIDEYNRLKLFQKAQVLEFALNQYLLENEDLKATKEESLEIEASDETQSIISVLEARSKKVIRRFIQGKTDHAVEEMHNIMDGFRAIEMIDRADALEQWMIQFLEKKVDEDERNLPLSECLENDPEIEEQLLSYRTQKVIKRFAQGKPRKAVTEFTEIVNEYKQKGRLDIVEMLEIWFNLFITKMYFKPSTQQAQPPQEMPSTSLPSPVTTPPSQNLTQKLPISKATPSSKPEEVPIPSPDKQFKDKISKIKSLLKNFEESLS